VRLVSKLLPFPAPDGSEEPSRGNQGHFVPEGEGFTWRGLRFRTQSEVVIAQELEAAKLVFWPLCACRITGVRGKRETRELDFLVIHGGVAAILELDGGPHNGRAADDHRRDRLFEYHDQPSFNRILLQRSIHDGFTFGGSAVAVHQALPTTVIREVGKGVDVRPRLCRFG
jgi:hypothetical protein